MAKKNAGFDEKKILEQEGRVPPQAVEIEEALLGAMLFEYSGVEMALELVKESDRLYNPAHRTIFDCIKEMYEEEVDINLLSVEQTLRDKGLLDSIGGATVLSNLTRFGLAPQVPYYSQIIIEKWIKRNVILSATNLIKEAYDSTTDAYDVVDAFVLSGKLADEQTFITKLEDVSGGVEEMLLKLLHAYKGGTGLVGVPSGLPVDTLTAGFSLTDFYVLAARPSMGKTAYVLTIIINRLKIQNRKIIVFFSYEMSRSNLLMRLACMVSGVSLEKARRGQLNSTEWGRLFNGLKYFGFSGGLDENDELRIDELSESRLFIIDDNTNDIDDVRSILKRLQREYDIELVITDYLQLMPVRNPKEKNIYNREQEIAYTSKNSKDIAKKLNLPFIALSQLSRDVEKRSGPNKPKLSDLRESGSLEQDADCVIFLYRPEYYKIKTTPEGLSTNGLTEVDVAKQRNGPVGVVNHYFDKETGVFSEWRFQAPDAESKNKSDQWSSTGETSENGFGINLEDIEDDLPF